MNDLHPRETLSSRLGFILLSVGTTIGLGNIWRFPYIVGEYGGGMFVMLYLLLLFIFGFPLLTMELAIGRYGRSNLAGSIRNITGNDRKWVIPAKLLFSSNFLLMFYYTTISGWLLAYAGYYGFGSITQYTNNQQFSQCFSNLISNPYTSGGFMLLSVLIATIICFLGLQRCVEKVIKVMMGLLFILIIILALKSLTLPKFGEAVKFYLVPNFQKFNNNIFDTIYAAMGQAFFTLSIGCMAIFGSYTNKNHTLSGEARTIIALDTLVALLAGFIIFPICFSFDVDAGSGPDLIFQSLPLTFANMSGGRWWGAIFFIFLSLAALTTIIGVFENIISFIQEELKMKRHLATIVIGFIVSIMSIPCVLGFNVLKHIHPMGGNSTILDLEDFIVAQTIIPLAGLLVSLFCISKFGWGMKNFLEEANTGSGSHFPKIIEKTIYLVPVLILIIFIVGYYQTFFAK